MQKYARSSRKNSRGAQRKTPEMFYCTTCVCQKTHYCFFFDFLHIRKTLHIAMNKRLTFSPLARSVGDVVSVKSDSLFLVFVVAICYLCTKKNIRATNEPRLRMMLFLTSECVLRWMRSLERSSIDPFGAASI